MTDNDRAMRYMYSWRTYAGGEGFRQTVDENNKVVSVISIPMEEAKAKYNQFPNGEAIHAK